MRKKHRRSLLATALAYVFLFSCGTATNSWSAVTGHFTDLLPNPTSINNSNVTTGELYYNGYDWGVVTLAPSTSAGDAIARGPYTAYQLYVTSTVASTANQSTFTALGGSSSVGSTSIPAAWIASGRSIRVNARGRYSTTTAAVNWTWDVLLGTTSVLTTGAVAAVPNQTNQYFDASCVLTVSTTGASGTVNAAYTILVSSGGSLGGTANMVSYSTATAAAVAVDLTSQLTLNPRFTWGTSSASNSITFDNVIVEFLN